LIASQRDEQASPVSICLFEGLGKLGDHLWSERFRSKKTVTNHEGLGLAGVPGDIEEDRPFHDVSKRADGGSEIAFGWAASRK